ncbi:MAG TPA: metallophosphoesterase [Candidatus Eubacterium faecavium]|nr:metallophosphoesterase [Candidatus Eubacterium faecavium]
MIYAMADVHGEYEKYAEMLKKINFGKDDTLYILGDVIDRGKDSVRVLKDMAGRANVYPVVGNHELMALSVLEKLAVEITADNYSSQLDAAAFSLLLHWQQNGGVTTLKEFSKLPVSERLDLIDYLKDFAPFETAEAGGKAFILVHSGLGNFSKSKKLSEYTLEELCMCRPDYNKQLFDDVYIVSGHTPTQTISGTARIYQSCNNICIDCGAVFGGRLACLRLDDLEEFYV